MMEDPTPVASIPQKRPLDNDPEPTVTTPVKSIRSETSSPLSVLSVRTPSPMKLTTPNTTAPSSSDDPISSHTAPASSNSQQSAKRRKLTQKEKDDQRLEKEAKAQARADKKAQKDAEDKLKAEQKALKEAEKRSKEEDKQKKIDEREEKRRQKEEEQQQKEEEKAKKERSQMKLNAFFVKPKSMGVSAGKVSVESTQKPAPASVSLLPDESGAITNSIPSSPQKAIIRNAKSDYEGYFLPFNLQAHTILAPRNPLMEDVEKMKAAYARLDNLISQQTMATEPAKIQDLKCSLPPSNGRGLETCSVTDIVERVNGSATQPIDLTDADASKSERPLDILKRVPMKYIHFGEDVRPPYYGTYTKPYTKMQAARLARNPLSRSRQDTNYDYDSEAEWDEPEEGEDLDLSDDDSEVDADDDMGDFLDDEEDPQVKRRLISGDLQPVSTGLCWQDEQGVSRLNDGSGAICTEFREFSMGFLLQPQPHSIDPFSTAYWNPEVSATSTANTKTKETTNGSMNPPRAPLTQRTVNGLLNTLNNPQQPPSSTASKPTKAKRMISPEQLPAFKAEIEGKDMTKMALIEALKKAFPKVPKDAINNTLSVVAARVGPTEKEKRWVLINN